MAIGSGTPTLNFTFVITPLVGASIGSVPVCANSTSVNLGAAVLAVQLSPNSTEAEAEGTPTAKAIATSAVSNTADRLAIFRSLFVSALTLFGRTDVPRQRPSRT